MVNHWLAVIYDKYYNQDIINYKIGIVGLGVMGHNLALNMERYGFPVAGYDLDTAKTKLFLKGPAAGKNIIGVESTAELMSVLEKPRRILMMVPAGTPVDTAISHLKPYLEPGDILMDGGNSFFLDTERRNKELETEGFNYIGAGISGGEEGVLWGPAIMPGGQGAAWEATAPFGDPQGMPCGLAARQLANGAISQNCAISGSKRIMKY